jgi:hypothetical protein
VMQALPGQGRIELAPGTLEPRLQAHASALVVATKRFISATAFT